MFRSGICTCKQKKLWHNPSVSKVTPWHIEICFRHKCQKLGQVMEDEVTAVEIHHVLACMPNTCHMVQKAYFIIEKL